jgi:hypothetical protein
MARRRTATATSSLRVSDFLALVHEGVSVQLGPALDGFDTRQRFSYVQYWRGAPAIHYEVWAQRKTGRVEVGLHFEGERDDNYAAAAMLAERADDVFGLIGPEYELEEWTPQWTRLHRALVAPALTPEIAADAAAHAVALMRGMEPLLVELGLRDRAPER